MMLPQQWERVAQERRRDWEAEIRYRQLLAQLPATTPSWRRHAGNAMVWLGTWLLRIGERMVRHERPENVSGRLPVAG